MNRSAFFAFIGAMLLGWSVSVGCGDDENESTDETKTSTTALTQDETRDLLQLREEEKLARDVYQYAYDKYSLAIFKNIGDSEQSHMDSVLRILSSYDLEDPADENPGVFRNPELQSIYQELVDKVDASEADALIVGATVEDLDIKDIDDFLQRTSKDDVAGVYENLMCGSRNHLRSFYAQITKTGGSYSAAYISKDELLSIVQSGNETCGQ